MGAPKGNQFWRLRDEDGRKKIFQDPDALTKECIKYFEWCDENPWLKQEAVKAGDHFGETVHTETSRPYSINGLCVFLGIGLSTWKDYRDRKDFSSVCSYIEEIIYTRQFEGAAVGAYNANIIARKLGLTDKSTIEHQGDIDYKVVNFIGEK